MAAKTETYQIDTDLTLYDSSNSPLTVRAVNLALTKTDDEIIECHLTFQTNLKLYQYIDTKALFNLESDARISGNSGNFQESPPIQIEVSLKPDLLPHLQKHATNANEAAAYLLNQCQPPKSGELATVKTEESSNNPKSLDPLLATESWLALSVKQHQKSGEVGYRTLWSHASLLGLSMVDASQEKISESINSLFQDLGMSGLGFGDITKEITAESIGVIASLLRNLDEKTLEPSPQETTSTLQAEPLKATPQDTPSTQQIFQAIVNFFKEDNWHYAQINGQSALRLAFEGKNGKYDCYAQAREQQKQFVFYSVCPIKSPEQKCGAVGEFISRANYGMIIGNFELNFDTGEVRYKTSIEIEEDFSSVLFRRLVYTNVTMMDEYLPGIRSVIDNDVLPEEAITKIEG